MTYKIGIPLYDADNMLWEIKIGKKDEKMTLLYSVWGKSAQGCKFLAEKLIKKLEE